MHSVLPVKKLVFSVTKRLLTPDTATSVKKIGTLLLSFMNLLVLLLLLVMLCNSLIEFYCCKVTGIVI